MICSGQNGKALLRIGILTILFTNVGVFVFWDDSRAERDFTQLKTLLQNTRYQGVSGNQTDIAGPVFGQTGWRLRLQEE